MPLPDADQPCLSQAQLLKVDGLPKPTLRAWERAGMTGPDDLPGFRLTAQGRTELRYSLTRGLAIVIAGALYTRGGLGGREACSVAYAMNDHLRAIAIKAALEGWPAVAFGPGGFPSFAVYAFAPDECDVTLCYGDRLAEALANHDAAGVLDFKAMLDDRMLLAALCHFATVNLRGPVRFRFTNTTATDDNATTTATDDGS